MSIIILFRAEMIQDDKKGIFLASGGVIERFICPHSCLKTFLKGEICLLRASLAENGKRNYFSSLFKCFLPRLQCPRNFLKIENLLRHPALSIFSSALQSEIT